VNQFTDARLNNRALAAVNDVNFGGIDVDSDNVVSGSRKTRGGDTANVPNPKDTYSH
jgi:hypothetical protein